VLTPGSAKIVDRSPIIACDDKDHQGTIVLRLLPEDTLMTEAVVAQNAPYATEVEAGKSYFWCACGKSSQQPFCDGSHQDTDILPQKFTAEASKTVYFCGCKKTQKAPMCDGSHNRDSA